MFRLPWAQEVPSSNLGAPTNLFCDLQASLFEILKLIDGPPNVSIHPAIRGRSSVKDKLFSISLGDFWKHVFRTFDLISNVFRLDHSIGQIPRANVFERRSEEFSLASRHNVGNNNDHSRVQRFLSM